MKNIQRLGGYASLFLGFGFIAILILDFAVLAPQGFAGPDTPPELVMALVNTSAIPFQLLDIFSVLAMAACDKLCSNRKFLILSPMLTFDSISCITDLYCVDLYMVKSETYYQIANSKP